MTYYRLRPGVHQPAFQRGELYRYLGPTYPEGYIWLELQGRRRCVSAAHFERVERAERTHGIFQEPETGL